MAFTGKLLMDHQNAGIILGPPPDNAIRVENNETLIILEGEPNKASNWLTDVFPYLMRMSCATVGIVAGFRAASGSAIGMPVAASSGTWYATSIEASSFVFVVWLQPEARKDAANRSTRGLSFIFFNRQDSNRALEAHG